MLPGGTVPPDSKKTKLGVATKALLHCKNTEIVLVSCCAWNCALTAIPGVYISEVPECYLLRQMSFQ